MTYINNFASSCNACRRSGLDANHAPKSIRCCVIHTWTCGFCKENGHTLKHCGLLAEKKAREALRRREERHRMKAAFNAGEEIVVSRGPSAINNPKASRDKVSVAKSRFVDFDDLEAKLEQTKSTRTNIISENKGPKPLIGAWAKPLTSQTTPSPPPETHPAAFLAAPMSSSRWGDEE